uniref:Uncharacterized protein n=1 Tax=Anguilla anguilla TaxID=7936 RepID=A0A0E9PW61_ANGAN
MYSVTFQICCSLPRSLTLGTERKGKSRLSQCVNVILSILTSILSCAGKRSPQRVLHNI